jgi:hypothetical protein
MPLKPLKPPEKPTVWRWVKTHILKKIILIPALFLVSLLAGTALTSYAGFLNDALESGKRSASRETIYIAGRGNLPAEKVESEKTSSLLWGKSLLVASFALAACAGGPTLLQGLKKAHPILFAAAVTASLTVLTSAFNAVYFFSLNLPLQGVLCLGFSLWLLTLLPRMVLGNPNAPSLITVGCIAGYLLLPLYLIHLWFAPWGGFLLASLSVLLLLLSLLHFLLQRDSCKLFFARQEEKPKPPKPTVLRRK